MTEVTVDGATRCSWCGRAVPRPAVGRPRRYCRDSCRQRAYEARRRAERAGLSAEHVVLGPEQLADLRDRLYVLQAALDDIDAGGWAPRDALAHLYDAAQPLRQLWPTARNGTATW